MKNLTVENVYTRDSAKFLTKKNFWRLLGMMLVTGLIAGVLTVGSTYLLAVVTETPLEIVTTTTSYSSSVDLTNVSPAFSIGYALLTIISGLLGGGLTLGLMCATIDIARGEEKVPVGRVFSRMKYFLKYFGLSLWISFKLLLWMLPLLVLFVFAFVALSSAGISTTDSFTGVASIPMEPEVLNACFAVLPMVMMLLVLALVLPAVLRYSQATYILADEPSTGVFECVRKSKAMMKGHKWQLFKLPIPFLLKMYGWTLLILVAAGIVMGIITQVPSEATQIIAIVLMIVAYVLLLWKVLVYALRSTMAGSLFYLKRKGDVPAIPPEKEVRIVAWQPAEARTAPESVASADDHIACWNPGGEVKEEKE